MCKNTKRVACSRCGKIGLLLIIFPLLIVLHATAGPPDAEVLPPEVVVRSAPDPTAPVVMMLPGGTPVEVLFTQRGPGGAWAQIALPSGSTGFVPEQGIRRLIAPPQWRSAAPGRGLPSGAHRVGEGVLAIPLRRAGGVFLVAARINNQIATNFIVDTGASTVTISHELTDRLGLAYENTPKVRTMTASGFLVSHRVILDSIYIPDEGGAGVAGVEANVATLPGSPPGIAGLLGQSFLRHFQMTIEAERMVMHLQPIRR